MTTNRQRLARLETRADRFERIVAQALRRAIRAGTSGLGNVLTAAVAEPAEPFVSVDDLAAIETAWQEELRTLILPELGRTVAEGAQDAIDDLVLQVPVLIDARHPAAELFVAQADNRLRRVGADLWQNTRAQLVAGMADGESIPELARRVRDELASSSVRARTIARTEVISASNAGALAQMRSLGDEGPAAKTWLATMDARTRPTHKAADDQEVPLGDKFVVGGSMLDFPGDPTGPADEVINCRCTLTWAMEPAVRLVAAGFEVETEDDEERHTSGMIALIPERPLTVEGGEPAEESHMTLWFLGDTTDMPTEFQKELINQVEARAAGMLPVEANAFGAAVWNPNGEDPCIVLNVGGEGLVDRRHALGQSLLQAVADSGISSWELPFQHDPWSPHVCLAYDDDPSRFMGEALSVVGPITFDTVRIALGDEAHDFPLGGR